MTITRRLALLGPAKRLGRWNCRACVETHKVAAEYAGECGIITVGPTVGKAPVP
jgi:hypothetical protein